MKNISLKAIFLVLASALSMVCYADIIFSFYKTLTYHDGINSKVDFTLVMVIYLIAMLATISTFAMSLMLQVQRKNKRLIKNVFIFSVFFQMIFACLNFFDLMDFSGSLVENKNVTILLAVILNFTMMIGYFLKILSRVSIKIKRPLFNKNLKRLCGLKR